ncbi:MAG TPA: hypothetical protein VH599_07255 [Ktedonobacterales bacterium]|jgi:hypothetical protein
MKQPRTSDFDPNAKEHSLKSSMADFPAIEKPRPVQPKIAAKEQGTPGPEDQSTRVPLTSAAEPKRKIKKRHPFDIYEDQIEALRQRSIEDQKQGGIGSQSAMVREALDDWLAKVRGRMAP